MGEASKHSVSDTVTAVIEWNADRTGAEVFSGRSGERKLVGYIEKFGNAWAVWSEHADMQSVYVTPTDAAIALAAVANVRVRD